MTTSKSAPATGDELLDRELPPELMLNPEISRLAFEERILAFAEDKSVPLLERLRFLSMNGDRLDDFFMSRVARFKQLVATNEVERSVDGKTPAEQLATIAKRARLIVKRAYDLLDRLTPELAAQGIRIASWDSLTEADRESILSIYGARIEEMVHPLVADPSQPFPHIRNLRPALAIVGMELKTGIERFIAIELPGDLPRFLELPQAGHFVALEDAIKAHMPQLYPGLEVSGAHLFRVTRSGNMDLDDEPRDILRAVEVSVTRRPFQEVVRLECEAAMPMAVRRRLRAYFQEEMEGVGTLGDQDVYEVAGLLDLSSIVEIAKLDRPELKFPPLKTRTRIQPDRCVLDHARRRDLLMAFPQDDFAQSVERFLHEAADDPNVVHIAITVYRTSKDSEIVAALLAAREKGKEVTAVIEVKASNDEQANIAWARDLEKVGIRVIVTPVKFKVHAKLALIVRREGDVLRRVAYIGTGNMSASTAKTYIDFGLLTADPELTHEVEMVFNLLTGDSENTDFNRLIVAPFKMRKSFLKLIEREIGHAKAGRPAGIRMHINGLADRKGIAALYRASQAGVRVEMMVRDICSLRPGLKGVSETVSVVSVVGRLLHHARIFHFTNGGADEYFIGSADWRPRNFNERVEVVAQIQQPDHQAELGAFLTETLSAPHAWRLLSNGEYVRVSA